jgi:hypothetical protein
MSDAILVPNAGSSSFTFTEFVIGEAKVSSNLEALWSRPVSRQRCAR